MKTKNILMAFAAGILVLTGCQSKSDQRTTLSGILKSNFETSTTDGNTDLYVLKNKNGMEVCMTNFGGRIVSIMAPDKNGKFEDVVLGFDSIADYMNISSDFGAFIGRYGNRIGQGRFTLDGVEYQLPQNNYGHCLHGGPKGFQYQFCDIQQTSDSSLILSYLSKDGEEGFPGNLDIKVLYTLNNNNELSISYEATTDKPTIVNLTNHSYFNLSGNGENTVLDQVLMIDADAYTPIDSTFMTTGEIATVEGTPMDFRTPKTIGEQINDTSFVQIKNGHGYDHNFVLNTKGDITKPAVRLVHPASGRVLEVFTDEPGIQVYTGNFLDGTVTGKGSIAYPQRSAICLETQHYPDSPNKSNFPSVVLRPGEKYTSNCIYKFSVEK
ncbi:aldose epimerase family protein [Coprobacter tertius]|uniref:Aldose 1-epimerase n=1 Tax=Coprobacter tertius TaxID=2944915 RepID=A0ABT1MNW6_9BACT|nr:aldose epimerase family protein [Coprobacter tertius]MCP9612981.1 galactose mutarotase [Coprobacter tertius]